MKKRLILAATAVVALSSMGSAQARDNINWSITVGDPFIGAVISNGSGYGHGYRHVTPVYVAPPVVYAPPPRIIYPRPYVVAPYGYVPYAYVQPGRDRWERRRYEERTRYDRRDWRDWRDGDRHDRDGRWDDRGGRHDDRWQRR
jgi:hypothetical protein